MGVGEICVSLAESTAARLKRRLAAVSFADVVELRLDGLDDPAALTDEQLAALMDASVVPVLATCRPTWEGGRYAGGEDQRIDLLRRALRQGAWRIDIEIDAAAQEVIVGEFPGRVLVSHHWAMEHLDDLEQVVERLVRLRPAAAKLVAPVKTPAAAMPLLNAATRLRAAGIATACFGMGEAAKSSRLLAIAAGDSLIYASDASGRATAPGQWTARTLCEQLLLGGGDRGRRCWA